MIIYLLAPDFRTLGGYEGQLAALAAGLQARGARVHVFCRRPVSGRHPYWQRLAGAGVYLNAPRPWWRWLDPPEARRRAALNAALWLSRPLLLPPALLDRLLRRRPWRRSWQGALGRARRGLIRLLWFNPLDWRFRFVLDRARRREPPDVIDVQHSMLPGGITYAHERGIPVVYTEYGAPDPALRGVWDHLAGVIHQVDHIIGRAAASYAGLATMHGVDRPHTLIANAVSAVPDTPAAPPAAPPVVITAIGRLAPEKEPLTLLHAVRDLLAADLPVRLVFAGDGPLRAAVETQARAWGLAERVQVTGVFDQLAPILTASHIVAHASRNDGRSVAVLEAMAWGRPVVAAASGGVRELIEDGVSGRLVPPGDAAALAAALRELVLDEAARRQFGAAARQAFVAGQYTPAAMVDSTLAVYRQVQQNRSAQEQPHAH